MTDSVVTPIILPALGATARNQVFGTPFQFFLSGAESLRIVVNNALAGVVVTIRVRFYNDLEALNWQQYTVTPTSDRAATTVDFPLGAGIVSNVVAFASSGFPVIGQTFVQASIITGIGAAALRMATLLQGYITRTQPVAFPGSPIQSSLEGGGYVRYIEGAIPPVGTLPFESVPTGARWELISYQNVIQCDAVAGTRKPYFVFGSNIGQPFLFLTTTGTLAPLGINRCQWVQGLPYETQLSAGPFTTGLPRALPLLAGQSFGMNCDNFDVGDAVGAPRYVVREWLEA